MPGRFVIDPSMLKMPSVTINIFSQGFWVFGWPETIFCLTNCSKCLISKKKLKQKYLLLFIV